MTVATSPDIQFPKLVVASSSLAARFKSTPSVQVCHTPAHLYHRFPEPSCSQLKCLRESPQEFYWRYVRGGAPPKNSEA